MINKIIANNIGIKQGCNIIREINHNRTLLERRNGWGVNYTVTEDGIIVACC